MTRTTRTTLALVALLFQSQAAHATLGGNRVSIESNRRHLAATTTIANGATAATHELRLPSGGVVREYVTPSGAVFAVSWHGRQMPDLRELLGSYFDTLGSPDAQRRGGHHHKRTTASDLIVESGGHNHSFSGHAWVPSLVPADFPLATLAQ